MPAIGTYKGRHDQASLLLLSLYRQTLVEFQTCKLHISRFFDDLPVELCREVVEAHNA